MYCINIRLPLLARIPLPYPVYLNHLYHVTFCNFDILTCVRRLKFPPGLISTYKLGTSGSPHYFGNCLSDTWGLDVQWRSDDNEGRHGPVDVSSAAYDVSSAYDPVRQSGIDSQTRAGRGRGSITRLRHQRHTTRSDRGGLHHQNIGGIRTPRTQGVRIDVVCDLPKNNKLLRTVGEGGRSVVPCEVKRSLSGTCREMMSA